MQEEIITVEIGHGSPNTFRTVDVLVVTDPIGGITWEIQDRGLDDWEIDEVEAEMSLIL